MDLSIFENDSGMELFLSYLKKKAGIRTRPEESCRVERLLVQTQTQSWRDWSPHLPVRAQTRIFLVRISQCTVHSVTHMLWLKVQKGQCRAFLKNIVISSSSPCQVSLSLVSLLSLHLLLVLCHDLQRHRHFWRGLD